MTRRAYVRITSYIIFSLSVLIATAILNTRSMVDYRDKLEVSYQQSLSELGECLDTVNTDLTKSLYSNSSGEIYDISRDLYAACSVAKNALSRLPVSQMELANTYKFLSQAGDYAQYIGAKIEDGKAISDEEHKNLATLLNYSEKFCDSADNMVRIAQAGGRITDGDIKNTVSLPKTALSNSFSQSAKTFESFPTLLYDGPFSDQVLNKKSKFVKDDKVFSRDECKEIVADCLETDPALISFQCDDKSKLPCYTFNSSRYNISVTKQGGYIKSILYSGLVKSSDISEENAINIASSFLDSIGYKNMEESYYSTGNNICTINFVYCKNDVWYYPDLIKCGVSMSDGRIVSLDAQTYLTNHIKRNGFKAKISKNEAASRVSPYLTVNSSKKCVIPKESGKEARCWEFSCTSSQTGEDALVYINASTGKEEDIMLLLHTDGGTLVK
ncbi:MAG: germination protein YpeB [Eubacterium sp.]|nr:germination protein YpeB [Eubacterium sp.]